MTLANRLLRREQLTAPPPLVTVRSPLELARDAGYPDLDRWQVDVLTTASPRLILLACRQSGKSTVVALRATHTAIYEPGALVLITAAAQRQSQELFGKVMAAYRALGRPVPADAESRLTLELENGSRIIALPGRTDATLRSFSAPRLVICDEASRQPDELLFALSPMLATAPRSQLILLSTPHGQRGNFFELWQDGRGWEHIGPIMAGDCPRIPGEFLETERQTMPDRLYRQEYQCSFEDTDDQVFASEYVTAALDDTIPPLFGAA